MILRIKGEESAGDPKSRSRATFSELVAAERHGLGQSNLGGPPLERRSISEQVANRIMAMIKSGNLKSGDQLPTEAQMTLALRISRPPLREGLKALTIMGVLESRQGGRYTLLSVADRLCTERASPELQQRILKLAVDGRAFRQHPVAFRLLDIEFHDALYVGASNQLLRALAQGLYDVGLDVRRVASTAPGVIKKSVGQHIEIAEAVVAHDAAAATVAYRRHLEHGRDSTNQSMAPIGPL